MDAKEWVIKYITEVGGEVLADAMREDAKKQGFKRGELKQARKDAGVKTLHQQDTGMCFWYLEE